MKRTRLSLLALLGCCCVLAACAAHPRTPVTIIFWHSELENTPRGRLIAEFAHRFAQDCPWVTVVPVYAGRLDELGRKARVAVRAGAPPDLAALRESDIASLMQQGALTTLDAYLADDELGIPPQDQTDFYPGAWQSIRYPEFGNHVLALPYAKSAVGLYYNRTLLQACGIEEPPATWEAFERACLATRTLDARGYACIERATTFEAWLQSRGGSLLTPELDAAAFGAAPGHDSLDLLLRLLDMGRAYRPEGEGGDLAAFVAGEVVFTMDLTSALPFYVEALQGNDTLQWGCTLVPQQDPSRGGTVLVGPAFCVFASDEARQQAAWRFAKWFNEPPQATEWAATGGSLPLRRSVLAQLAENGWREQNAQAAEAFEAIAPRAWPEPRLGVLPELHRILEAAWLSAAAGVREPQQALDEAAGRANQVLIGR